MSNLLSQHNYSNSHHYRHSSQTIYSDVLHDIGPNISRYPSDKAIPREPDIKIIPSSSSYKHFEVGSYKSDCYFPDKYTAGYEYNQPMNSYSYNNYNLYSDRPKNTNQKHIFDNEYMDPEYYARNAVLDRNTHRYSNGDISTPNRAFSSDRTPMRSQRNPLSNNSINSLGHSRIKNEYSGSIDTNSGRRDYDYSKNLIFSPKPFVADPVPYSNIYSSPVNESVIMANLDMLNHLLKNNKHIYPQPNRAYLNAQMYYQDENLSQRQKKFETPNSFSRRHYNIDEPDNYEAIVIQQSKPTYHEKHENSNDEPRRKKSEPYYVKYNPREIYGSTASTRTGSTNEFLSFQSSQKSNTQAATEYDSTNPNYSHIVSNDSKSTIGNVSSPDFLSAKSNTLGSGLRGDSSVYASPENTKTPETETKLDSYYLSKDYRYHEQKNNGPKPFDISGMPDAKERSNSPVTSSSFEDSIKPSHINQLQTDLKKNKFIHEKQEPKTVTKPNSKKTSASMSLKTPLKIFDLPKPNAYESPETVTLEENDLNKKTPQKPINRQRSSSMYSSSKKPLLQSIVETTKNFMNKILQQGRTKCRCDPNMTSNEETCLRAQRWLYSKYKPEELPYLKKTYYKILREGEIDAKSHKQIRLDILRTYPECKFFSSHSEGSGCLERVLQAYATYDPKVGYVQGMNFIAASILYHAEEYIAFWIMAMVFEKCEMMDIYQADLPGLSKHAQMIHLLIMKNMPNLFSKLAKFDISVEMFCIEWVCGLFGSIIPIEKMGLFLDCFIKHGWVFFYKFVLALLGEFEEEINKATDMTQIMLIFKQSINKNQVPMEIENGKKSKISWDNVIKKAYNIHLDNNFIYNMHSQFDPTTKQFNVGSNFLDPKVRKKTA